MKKPPSHVPRPMAMPDELTGWVSYLLRQAGLRAQVEVGRHLAKLSLRPPHHSVMAMVEDGPSSQAALAARLQTDRTTMVTIIDELEGMGLVQRRASAGDRRVHDVTLTGDGQVALQASRGAISGADDALLEPLDPSEREHLATLLRRVIAHHDQGRTPRGD